MLHIVTALPCEAKPLIRHYGLGGHKSGDGFRVYENRQIRLIIAGVGKHSAFAACAHLQEMSNNKHTWLNLGIAGHKDLSIGTAVLAHKITDATSGTVWHPEPFIHSWPTVELVSVDQPQTDYAADTAYDMEASGFYASASRFNSNKYVQVLKLISDNDTSPPERISARFVEEIIDTKLNSIDELIQQLIKLEKQQA